MTVMVPTMIGMLLDHEAFRPERLASLRTLTYGASPMPAALLDRLLDGVPDARHAPGLRHDGVVGGAHRARPRRAPRRRRVPALGRPTVARRRAVDPGRRRQAGRRRARPARCARAAATSCASTGTAPTRPPRRSATAGTTRATRATSTSEGYLFLVDRVKDMIVTGGENVYSVEVENAIASYPDVAQVAVIGIPDEKWGEAVHAIVVPQRRARTRPKPRSSRTRASRSRATRCRSRSRSAPSRCRSRAR